MKGIISIFVMPQEIDDLASTLEKLKRNSVFIDKSVEYGIDITMCLSSELTDWENSKLPRQYFEDRTREIVEKYCDWCEYKTLTFELSNHILGCVSQRRESLKNHPDADFFIWLDTDIVFKDDILYYISSSYQAIKNSGVDMFIITPQFVKQWDNTWDVITNKKYKNYPINYHVKCDIYEEGLPQSEEINITSLNEFKFAGGWFTLISKPLLDTIGIPDSLGHYGLEDTFVMACSSLLLQKGKNVKQFMMENLIIGENHKNRPNEYIKTYLSLKDRKDEFRKQAHDNFEIELNNFIKKM
jgi:hypothetical protein